MLTQSSIAGELARLTTLRAVAHPNGDVELGWERQAQRAGSDRVFIAAADVLLAPHDFAEWLSAVAALLSPEDRIRLAERLRVEPDAEAQP